MRELGSRVFCFKRCCTHNLYSFIAPCPKQNLTMFAPKAILKDTLNFAYLDTATFTVFVVPFPLLTLMK